MLNQIDPNLEFFGMGLDQNIGANSVEFKGLEKV
jgi:hypothetical protein